MKIQHFAIFFLITLGLLGGFVWSRAQAVPFCGDGVVNQPTERCDSGTEDGDKFCTAQCAVKLFGFGWSSNFGWLSLHDGNCDYRLDQNVPIDCVNRQEYFLQVDGENQLRGFAWSDNLGWMCFGRACSCDPGQPGSFAQTFGISQAVCAAEIGGAVPAAGADGWDAVVESLDLSGSPDVDGWAKALRLKDHGWFSLHCNNTGCAASNYRTRIGSTTFYPDNNLSAPVTLPTLIGYAWHDYDDGGGLGWVQFTATGTPAWLQTRLGDIYAGGGFKGTSPQGVNNATYRILANGSIEHTFTSSAQNRPGVWVDPTYGLIDFPTPQTRYTNILGRLDVAGLICTNWNDQDECTNSYGGRVVNLAARSLDTVASQALGNAVYYHAGNLTIDADVQIKNGAGFTNGAGTIIIDGDLIIDGNVSYDQSSGVNAFRNLASISWIVRGDVIINPAVTNLAGAFIVLGDGTMDCSVLGQAGNGCGRFSTGASSTFLDVSGLVMARQFSFERTGISESRGSELIVYDGRLLANTPPGLSNFAQALPIWRPGIFTQ